MRYALAILVGILLLVPIAAPAQGQGDEATIRKNIELWVQQYNKHDAAALAKWYRKTAVYVTPTGEMFLGPEQIQQYFEKGFQQSAKEQISVQVTALRVEKPDLMVGYGTFEVTGIERPGGMTHPMKGPWVATFVKEGAEWFPLTHAASMQMPMMMMKK